MSHSYTSPQHDRVGGIPETMGPWQVEFLRKQGMEPHHRLLDLGCGTLRGGLRLIEYLDTRCYVGVDPLEDLVDAGRSLLVEAKLISKEPMVGPLELIDELPQRSFDYVLTQSVLNHLDAQQIKLTVGRVARMLKTDGRWATTGHFSKDVSEVDLGEPHPVRPNELWRSVAGLGWFRAVLAAAGFAMALVHDHPHPRGQDVLVIRRTDAGSA